MVLDLITSISKISRELCYVSKNLGIELWSNSCLNSKFKLSKLKNDLDLIFELISHLWGIAPKKQEAMGPIGGVFYLLKNLQKTINKNLEFDKNKTISSILVCRLEPLLHDLHCECDKAIMEILLDQTNLNLKKQEATYDYK